MTYINYRTNRTPRRCQKGLKQNDAISGQIVYQDDLVPNDDGQMVDSRRRGTLDERPDLDGSNIAPLGSSVTGN